MSIKFITSVFSFFLISSSALAHDVWLEGLPYHTSDVTKSVEIGLYVGDNFVGEELMNLPDRYVDFSYFSTLGRTPVNGEIARTPAGFIKPNEAGTFAIGYRSLGSKTELDAATFNRYLEEEGLDDIAEQRKLLKQQDKSAKELFSRAVKALVSIGNSKTPVDFSDREFGYDLELINLKNPYHLKVGDALPVALKFNGKPLENQLITAFTKEDPSKKQKNKTDDNGHVTINLDRPGIWMIKSVKMFPSENDQYDWESIWASLTFELIAK